MCSSDLLNQVYTPPVLARRRTISSPAPPHYSLPAPWHQPLPVPPHHLLPCTTTPPHSPCRGNTPSPRRRTIFSQAPPHHLTLRAVAPPPPRAATPSPTTSLLGPPAPASASHRICPITILPRLPDDRSGCSRPGGVSNGRLQGLEGLR